MQVTETGSVRVDLVGGTLDIQPIHMVLNNAYTLNVATTLEAKVDLKTSGFSGVIIHSSDYKNTFEFSEDKFTEKNFKDPDIFGPMSFIAQILYYSNLYKGIELTLESGAPAGSGLGGSSAMGITLYKAICRFQNREVVMEKAVAFVQGVEGIILNQGMPGFQDYYPALTGGVLALSGRPGEVVVEQLYSKNLKDFLEKNITLIYSGISRNSGINNWDVYKKFFDKDIETRMTMQKIADISKLTYLAIKEERFEDLKKLIGDEGSARKSLAPGIVPEAIARFVDSLGSNSVGFKMCGAGGGGCFILVHNPEQKEEIRAKIKGANMEELPFIIKGPL